MLAVGLDHSLTAFGLVAIPASWECDFSRVYRETLETKPGEPAVVRRARLARDAARFVDYAARRFRTPLSAVRVAIEGGIANKRDMKTIRSQERLAAVVEDRLWHQLGIELEIAEQTRVRSTFMGPSLAHGRGAGDAAQALLRELVPTDWHEAELDAFIVANWALSDAGEAFVSVAPAGVKPAKARRTA